MNHIVEIDPKQLVTVVMIVAIETIGICQWLKNFIVSKRKPGFPRKRIAILSLILCTCFGYINTSYIDYRIAIVIDIIALSFAVVQLAWDIIVKGVPRLIDGMFDKAISAKLGENSSSSPSSSTASSTTESGKIPRPIVPRPY